MWQFKPTHQSHKKVEAYSIRAADFGLDGSGKVGFDHPTDGYVVVPVPAGFRRRAGDVSPGDFLVRYEPTADQPEGYLSHSPRAVFEAGYAAISPAAGSGLSFGGALVALKAGERVCRTGWNGKLMWLALTEGTPNLPAEKFWNPHNRAFAERNGGSATVLPSITMKTATGEILMGWLASQTDMLADDWMVVPADAA